MYKEVGGWEGGGRVGGRWKGGREVGGGWETVGGLHLPLGHRQWCCVFSKGQIQAQCTGYTEVVVSSSSSSSLALPTSLLMPSRGLTGSAVYLCGFTGLAKNPL